MIKRIFRFGLVLLVFGCLAVLWTWPLSQHLTDGTPYDSRFDSAATAGSNTAVWNAWWATRVVEGGEAPYFSADIGAPTGRALGWHAGNLGWNLALWPVATTAGPVTAANVGLLLALATSAALAWLLARELGCRPWSAGLAAFAWAFSPYFMLRGLHEPGLLPTPLLPLAMLLLLRWGSSSGHGEFRARLGHGALFGCALALLICSNFAIAIGFLLWAVLWLVLRPAMGETEGPSRRAGLADARAQLLSLAALGCVLALPLALHRRQAAPLVPAGEPIVEAFDEAVPSARFTDFLTPPGLHPAFRNLGSAWPEEGELLGARLPNGGLFVGFSMFALAIAATVYSSRSRRWMVLALSLLGVCLVSSNALGAVLPASGQWLSPPSRLFPVGYLTLCLTAGVGFDALVRQPGGLIPALLCASILPLEAWCGGYETEVRGVPESVRLIARLESTDAVCVLPFDGNDESRFFWQTIHGKPIVANQGSDLPQQARLVPFVYLPQLWTLGRLPWNEEDVGALELTSEGVSMDLRARGVGHVLMASHTSPENAAAVALLDGMRGWARADFEDGVAWWYRTRLTWTEPHTPESMIPPSR